MASKSCKRISCLVCTRIAGRQDLGELEAWKNIDAAHMIVDAGEHAKNVLKKAQPYTEAR